MKTARPLMICTIAVVSLAATSCTAWRFLMYKVSPGAPEHEGEIGVKGLAKPVRVVFDRHAVPHVNAGSDTDLAFAVGYLHARERLWQMELLRAVAYGRLAELFGDRPRDAMLPLTSTLRVDRWYRVMGIGRAGEGAARSLKGPDLERAETYAAGVNEYIRNGKRPVELELLEREPEPWTPGNVMAVTRFQGFHLSSNMVEELIRYLLRSELGEARQKEIFPAFEQEGPYIIDLQPTTHDSRPQPPSFGLAPAVGDESSVVGRRGWEETARVVLSSLADMASVRGVFAPLGASNSWVVGPQRSKSGKPILANDPHLSHTAPGAFYLMHLRAPGTDVIGATMPGIPAVVLGRNSRIAWGLTTTHADTQDIYLEKADPADASKYVAPGGSEPFRVEREVLRERLSGGGYREHALAIRFTRHGVVLNDALEGLLAKDAPILALRTTMTEPSDESGAMSALARATDAAGAMAALRGWGTPIQNWVFADDAGRIGYIAAGLVPKRKGWDGTFPVPGWTGEFEWDGFIPHAELPQILDPPSGMIVTANNQVMPPGAYPHHLTYDAMPGYRAGRIVEILKGRDKWTAELIQKAQTDVYVKQADRLLPSLLGAVEGMQLEGTPVRAREALKSWDRQARTDSVGATIFFATYREAWELALKDDLPPELHKLVCAYPYVFGFFDRLWAVLPDSTFFDDKNSTTVERRGDVLRAAFASAVRKLAQRFGPDLSAWQWGKLHAIEFEHVFGGNASLKETFNVGPTPIPGAHGTVWKAGWTRWEPELSFSVKYGPAFRQVFDFGAPGEGGMVVDLGQSGWAGTDHYANAVGDWTEGRLWPLSMDEARYSAGSLGTLVLTPAR
jgi:penicillin amidase